MNRCNAPHSRPTRPGGSWLAAICVALACAAAPAAAQVGANRGFPPDALRGQLAIQDGATAMLNGQAIRMAPGMRLFSPQNALVMTHTVQGQPLTVNYLTEASTGMLLTAWILTPAEAALPRKGSDATVTNIRTESDARPALPR